MAVPFILSEVPDVSPYIQYVATNGQTVFPYPFPITQDSDLIVVQGGVTLATDSGYTLSGQGNDTGGNVTFTLGQTPGTIITLYRDIQIQRISQIAQNSGFSSTVFNAEFNNIYLILQQLEDAIGFCLQVPNTNNPTPTVSLTPGAYANKYLSFDSNGNPIPAALTSSGTLTLAILGALLWPQNVNEITAGIVPTNLYDASNLSLAGDVKRYGCKCDGSTDDTVAFQRACTVGGEIIISAPMVLASASLNALTNNGISLNSNTRIRCVNNGSITISGSSPCNLFYSTNRTNIQIEGVTATGNGSAATSTTGYVWYCKADASAGANMQQLHVRNNFFTNFAGYYWIYFDNSAGTTYFMQDIRVEKNLILSAAGASQGNASQTITACVAGFSGSDTVNYFGIRDAYVLNNTVLGQWLKSLSIFWSGVTRGEVAGNSCFNFSSDSGFSNDVQANVIMVYDHAHGAAAAPDLIQIHDNIINGCRDNGIYAAAANHINVHGNYVTTQTSTANTTLPKGGIGINQASFLVMDNNYLDNCAIGVSVVLGSGNVAAVTRTTVMEVPGSGAGILVQPSGTGTVGDITLDGVNVSGTASSSTGVRFDSNSTIGLSSFTLRNFKIKIPTNALKVTTSDATTPALGTVTITDGVISGCAGIGINYTNCTNAATAALFENIVFEAPVSGELFVVTGSTGLTIRNITFNGAPVGTICWYGNGGATGTVSGVRFNNVVAGRLYSSGTDLGVALPTWAAFGGDYVQNFNPTVTGTGGFGTVNQKHWTAGWVYDLPNAAWTPDVRLTGA